MRLQSAPGLSKGHPGILHQYAHRLVAFEYIRGSRPKPHSLVFIGGLSDGLHTVEYLSDIILALQDSDWSVVTPLLSSSYTGWGMSSLGQDIDEIAQCVGYIRNQKMSLYGHGKVVIMGHSTGSQDVMHYISCANPRPYHPIVDRGIPEDRYAGITRPSVDGAIMQAPVSDREAALWVSKTGTEFDSPEVIQEVYRKTIKEAQKRTYETGSGDETLVYDTIVPLATTSRMYYPADTPLSSRRFLSLLSPQSPHQPDEDDLFSSDLADEQLQKTFGMVRTRGVLHPRAKLMVLYSGRDQSVPPWVDKVALLHRWQTILGEGAWHHNSTIIPGASHALSDPDQAEPRRILVERVTGYLQDMEKL
ncbi:putative esterase [Aspergillus saccharolyticus JOP 1030-1]|uniref:Putative hydrolases or acyltransferase n=1 Tax=Aspergillus saccharolyticus JOP 1030-1 TaxID=1450539 RepID=A0A318ZEM6_9EURO|nr:putative hydrolases or acyltransferase [Aspergillus saccharolyticus JOP 1030-1]PYH45565.1 putative hydrolases or acyltransferase [Aspergillus saccharolyticus JOP 1030-1]